MYVKCGQYVHKSCRYVQYFKYDWAPIPGRWLCTQVPLYIQCMYVYTGVEHLLFMPCTVSVCMLHVCSYLLTCAVARYFINCCHWYAWTCVLLCSPQAPLSALDLTRDGHRELSKRIPGGRVWRRQHHRVERIQHNKVGLQQATRILTLYRIRTCIMDSVSWYYLQNWVQIFYTKCTSKLN